MATVRAARLADVPALIALQLANADRHIELDPAIYRRPDPDAVRDYFVDRLADPARSLVFVAELAGAVVGMVEVLLRDPPPAHQILVPTPSAAIHTVVLPGHRGAGIGGALVDAAVLGARELGAGVLIAGINAANVDAVRFYAGHGFTDSGVSLARPL
jgi:GNAT superfamily N-acetyltransferase